MLELRVVGLALAVALAGCQCGGEPEPQQHSPQVPATGGGAVTPPRADAGTTVIAGPDGGWVLLVDGGSTIEAPQDAGPSTCTCRFTRPGEPTGGFSVTGITFPCGVALCSASGGHIGCDGAGMPSIPDLPACQPMDSCFCEIAPGHRLRCDTVLCSGELGNRTAWSCSDKGVLTLLSCR